MENLLFRLHYTSTCSVLISDENYLLQRDISSETFIGHFQFVAGYLTRKSS